MCSLRHSQQQIIPMKADEYLNCIAAEHVSKEVRNSNRTSEYFTFSGFSDQVSDLSSFRVHCQNNLLQLEVIP